MITFRPDIAIPPLVTGLAEADPTSAIYFFVDMAFPSSLYSGGASSSSDIHSLELFGRQVLRQWIR